MPELPEVETIRRDLEAYLLGQKIVSVKIFFPKTAKNPAAFFSSALRGRKITAVSRRGKLLFFSLNKRPEIFLLVHLKMTGQLIYENAGFKLAGGHGESGSLKELPGKHTRAMFEFSGRRRLFFNDLRKFGYLKIVEAAELKKILAANYGPEPLSSDFSVSVLKEILENKKRKIKAVLLDQRILAGLGNIYVDEALFAARLHPERLAASLRPAEIAGLYRAINRIIKAAIKYRGTTFNNYVDSRGQKGNFSARLQVYGRKFQLCSRCRQPIQKKKVAGRGTHYCAFCQK